MTEKTKTMSRPARIVTRRGQLWPDGWSEIWEVRAGRRGRGRRIYHVVARGNAHDAGACCRAAAERLGYDLVEDHS